MNVQTYMFVPKISVIGKITPDQIHSFQAQIGKKSLRGGTNVAVRITSAGGAAYAAKALHDDIGMLAQVAKVDIVACGECSAEAIMPLVAVPRQQRFATANTTFTFRYVSKDYVALIAAACGVDPDQIGALCRPKRTSLFGRRPTKSVLTATEALELGLIDSILAV